MRFGLLEVGPERNVWVLLSHAQLGPQALPAPNRIIRFRAMSLQGIGLDGASTSSSHDEDEQRLNAPLPHVQRKGQGVQTSRTTTGSQSGQIPTPEPTRQTSTNPDPNRFETILTVLIH